MKFVDEGIKVRAKLTQTSGILQTSLTSSRPGYLGLQRLQIVANFIHDLIPQGPNSIRHSHIGGWLWLIPSIMRHNQTLDFAAEALASIYFAKKSGPSKQRDTAMMQSSESYVRAIRKLSGAIQNPNNCLSSEVLCASLLLVHYEVSAQYLLFVAFKLTRFLHSEVFFVERSVMAIPCQRSKSTNQSTWSIPVSNTAA